MKIKIHYGDIKESFEARDAADALRRFKAEAGKRAPFMLRPVIGAMGELKFAAEVVSRANGQNGRQDPAPQNAQQFLDWAAARGYITVEE